ncbi:uncharacterized protein K444DRAFT_623304 [Hyaloscypha bicolor E]|uniref:Uncharacterized protein n=1 Tax=Hyaloscypha bicolor E TaxID=1095630 RepID=A0A2J6TVM5_9HELO|nr:uncharacterized protein K444DRAFT_623304 [Hyaloscypha bicolor E]PMD67082.1 hypothetical protein K444DRAFT_623304 [Hyaloscypha bicolor E]
MVRINTSSIFKSVDLDDAGSIRRVMVALDYCLANRMLNNATPESELFKRQKNSKRVRFIEATNGSDQQVLAAARDMEILVIGIVFTVPQAFPEEYAAAEARLNGGKATDSFMTAQQSSQTLQQRAPGSFGEPKYSSHNGAKLEELKQNLESKSSKKFGAPTLNVA